MRERGIIFNAEMVRAILDGRKTQTRRIIKLDHERSMQNPVVRGKKGEVSYVGFRLASSLCPFGQPGDRLWVRETHRVHSCATDVATLAYRASERQSWTQQTHRVPVALCDKPVSAEKWTPSIHMPRWASRITLEITGVRVERLQDISEADSRAEGTHWSDGKPNELGLATELVVNAKDEFDHLWRSIYGAESWQANPWVWVVEFKRVENGQP